MYFILFIVGVIKFLSVHGQQACNLYPIDRMTRKVHYNGRYYLGDASTTQSAAEECCKSSGLALATITSDEESTLVSRLYRLFPHNDEDKEGNVTGSSVWVASDLQIKKNMYKTGEGPCNLLSIQMYLGEFMQINIEGTSCDAKSTQFLCEDKGVQSIQPETEGIPQSKDIYSKTKINWAAATNFCNTKGKSLLNKLSPNQKSYILKYLQQTADGKNGIWTGAFKDKTLGFRWESGLLVTGSVEDKDNEANKCMKLVAKSETELSYVSESCVTQLPFACSDKPSTQNDEFGPTAEAIKAKFDEMLEKYAGSDLNEEEKQTCQAQSTELISGTSNLYCIREKFSWRKAISCCKLKGMVMATFRSNEEKLQPFSCTEDHENSRGDKKFIGPWTGGNNFLVSGYAWMDTVDLITEDVWDDVWYNDNGFGSCVHYHGTQIKNREALRKTVNPLCPDGNCWGLLTNNCERKVTFVCRKPKEVPTTPRPGKPCPPPSPKSPTCDCLNDLTLQDDLKKNENCGIYYAVGKTKETFFQSIQECRKLNMTLLAIEYPKESEHVNSLCKTLDGDLWTSGTTTKSQRKIQWMSTGRFLHYHPNGWTADVSQDKCLAVSNKGVWTLSDCGTKNYYMCEFRTPY